MWKMYQENSTDIRKDTSGGTFVTREKWLYFVESMNDM